MKKLNFSDNRISNIIEDILIKEDKKTLVTWALDCADHVLQFFEEKYPHDHRPRKAIEVGREWLKSEIKMDEIRSVAFAAHAAARETKSDASCAAARSAGQAISTIHTLGHARHAATYAAKAAYYSSFSWHDEYSIAKERDWQLQRLLELIKLQDSV